MDTLYRTLTGQSHRSSASGPSTSRAGHGNTGVLNHLTDRQQKLLAEFKERLRQDGWWSPDGVNGQPSHDDPTLL